ncbi:hypothetical protein [Paenibacillus agricola]|uniref:BlaR1 peptidase M56 n=1 Tax=Paenibacillus agricola TaxID=2716264 RepID=A0ABX0J8M8_9BACL|nr:hypothetical protein [Paenibacillus agricola]NHN31953.1 hypothetical protein [Paenibacillus agricola]
MSISYLTIIFLLLVLNCLRYWKKLGKQPPSIRWMYRIAYSLSLALYICIILHIKVPMPTQFFINKVSPWAFNYLNR